MKHFLLVAVLAIFHLAVFATPGTTISSFTPAAGGTGTTLTINGTNFTGATVVTIGGTAAASFTIVSSTKITAVVAAGASGSVSVTSPAGTASASGFIFSVLTDIYTDFGGYWASSTASPNIVIPNNSYNLLAFKFNGTIYSTGANNSVLTTKGITYSNSVFKALPVAGISGTTPSTATSNYIALAKNVDGSATVADPVTVSSYTIKSVLTDGLNGLNLGTGITNLPASAILKFKITSIDPTKINDAEPDILITQIAQPVSGNDVFSFVDASGAVVGSSLSHDMTLDAAFGTYDLDLFNLKPSTAFNYANVYTGAITATNREIRLVALKLSDFNITAGMVSQIAALQITPSGNSDYAFIAYNTGSINLPPNISTNDASTNATVCSGGTANLSVIGASAASGSLSYAWQRSTNGGSTWNAVSDGAGFSGSGTATLAVANAVNNDKYQASVTEAGNASASSSVFTIVVSNATAPTAVTVSSSASTTCLNTPVLLTSSVSGGSNLYYQWQFYNGSAYTNIAGANLNTYSPPVDATGNNSYSLLVNSGSGCPGISATTPAALAVTGIASVTGGEVCNSGVVTLNATATSGTVGWYTADAGGTAFQTANAYTTSSLASTTTYYVASSGCASALRVPVTALVDLPTAGGSISNDTTVFANINIAPLNLTGNTGSVVKWQSSTDNFVGVVNDISTTSPTYTATNLTQTTKYRAVVKSGVCALANSLVATITVVPGALPVAGINLKATPDGGNISVQWNTTSEVDMNDYVVEKKVDSGFVAAYSVTAANNILGARYDWLDTHVAKGDNFYRIKAVDFNGHTQYSEIVKAAVDMGNAGISFYPNPVSGNRITLLFSNMPSGNYVVKLFSSSGRMLSQTRLVHQGGNANLPLPVSNSLAAGIYNLYISGPANKTTILSMVKIHGM